MSASLASVTAHAVPAPLRIAHVITESSPFGGAQRNTLLTIAGLVRSGHHVDLLCGAGGELIERAAERGATVTVLPDLVRRTRPIRDLRTARALYRIFRAVDYDIVHTHSTKAGWLGRMAAIAAGVPVVVHTVHGFPFPLDAQLGSRIFVAIEGLVARGTDGLICVAEALRREVATWTSSPRPKVVTIYSGIDFASMEPRNSREAVREALALGDSWPVIGAVGHLREAKAYEVLIEAAGILRQSYPRLRLLIVGEGERREFLESRIRPAGLSAFVKLLGERHDVADLLGTFDVYAMSSRWEGVGRAMTEAMYRGLPVVATGVYGVPELILHEETGLIVPSGDPAALAQAIDRLMRDRALAERLGAAAHRRVVERMSGAAMVAAIERLYEQLAQEKNCLRERRVAS
jgi:glycosyltransferase involved in cell wall biosynthesis